MFGKEGQTVETGSLRLGTDAAETPNRLLRKD